MKKLTTVLATAAVALAALALLNTTAGLITAAPKGDSGPTVEVRQVLADVTIRDYCVIDPALGGKVADMVLPPQQIEGWTSVYVQLRFPSTSQEGPMLGDVVAPVFRNTIAGQNVIAAAYLK